MNANVSLDIPIDSLAELGPLQTKLEELGRISSLHVYNGDEPGVEPMSTVEAGDITRTVEELDTAEVDPDAEKKAKKAATAKKRRAAKAAAAAAETEAADPLAELVDDDPLGAEEPEVDEDATEKDLKIACKTTIDAIGIDAVRAVFLKFKSKAGKPCAKMNDVKPADIGKVIAVMAAAVEKN